MMKEKYIRNNFTKNIYRGRRRKRFVSRQIVRLTVLLFLCLCAIMVLGFSWKESLKKEGAFQIPAISFGDNAPAADIHGEQGTAEKPAQASAVQGGESQASDTDIPWQLTLVNQQNPIPDNYEPDLVQAHLRTADADAGSRKGREPGGTAACRVRLPHGKDAAEALR